MARRATILASALFGLIVGGAILAPSATETAVANGDTRTIHFYHTHTGESIDATFRVDGHYDAAVLRQLNHFLRDWRNNDETTMDPRLFDTLWEVYRTAGAREPIQIYSAYRSPETNAMLRRRSRAVAEHSQHMLGKAMDTTIPGFPMHLVREIGMRLQHGGVGWYPSANFVHLDVGSVRSWPRMSYDQLASLFPDGKTVHIASNGQVLPGYEAARQEIALRGDIEVPPAQESGGFFAWLFGGGSGSGAAKEDEEDRRVAVAAAPVRPAPAPAPVAAPVPQPIVQETALAYAGNEPTVPQPALTRQAPPIDAEQIGTAEAPASRQVASLETGTTDASRAAIPLGGVLPLPPRRPAELAAAPDIPLPPIRPDALSRLGVQVASVRPIAVALPAPRSGLDAIGSLITKTASGVPSLRRSRLPAVLTQGGRTPGQALAFAPPEVVARDEVPTLRLPVGGAAPRGLRAALRTREPVRTGSPVLVALPETSPLAVSPRLTGLRKAARETTGKSL